LIFIDEQPGYNWVHRAKIAFFPTKSPKQARLVFSGIPPSCLKMSTPEEEQIKVSWEEW